ncbi:MAG: hypothetical protein BGO38_13960 [Cellulomonas sp. 73-145]|uniref:hypothetical protein n=1 Tax=Cellulomonas sp. 73-145 TaxID=1895739 RepID=UPI00092BA885|nr:hypothetical protein [Cellulomonas sp. 73-145]OJV59850.1 MAG: hypothetical protein BGO38_13960 [Cellulomonas sp. 73-145]
MWLVGVAVTGLIASRAVAVLDTDTSRSGVLSRAEVDRVLVAARAAAVGTATSPAATPTTGPATPTSGPVPEPSAPVTAAPPPRPAPSTAAPAPTTVPVARTWTVPGGTVAASCTGSAISLLYATPLDGWTVEVGAAGPDHLEVELRQSGTETKVTAVCVAGVPQQTATQGTPDGGADHSSSDG